MDLAVATRHSRPGRARWTRLFLCLVRRNTAVPLSGWLDIGRTHYRRSNHGRRPSTHAPIRGSARVVAAAVGRSAVVRDLPVALACICGHPAPVRHTYRWLAAACV